MLGDNYDQVDADFCNYFDLDTPEMHWHTQCEWFTQYCDVLTMVAQLLGKFGRNLLVINQTQVGKFHETYANGRQGSTVIPTVGELYMCEAILNLATIIRNEMPLMYDAMQATMRKIPLYGGMFMWCCER